ncbi:hypothetical protein KAX29_07615, partial [candidate division WOR-3 bacterium]|nr:hypothetical protein [candidate division WOR-3 bacterium]
MTNNFTHFIKNMTTILVENGPELLITLLGLTVLHFIIRRVMKKFARLIIIKVSKKVGMTTEQEKRITTINALFTRVAFILLWGIGIIIILGELNINIAPIL